MSSSGDYPDLYSQLGLPKPGEGQVRINLLPLAHVWSHKLYCYLLTLRWYRTAKC